MAPTTKIDAFAGGRLWSLDEEIKFGAGLLPSQKASHRETFVDPIVGASARYQFAPKWSVAASGSIGGFGVAADLEWSLTGVVNFQAGESWGVLLGYRYLSLDYEDDGFVFDVDLNGPVLGAYFNF